MNVIIAGAGEVGGHAAEVLSSSGHNVTVIEMSADKLRRMDESIDIGTVEGNCTHFDLLERAGAGKCDLFVAATQVDEANLLSASIAKMMGAKKTIVRTHHRAFFQLRGTPYAHDLGIDMMICPEYATSLEIARMLRNPGAIAIEDFAKGHIAMQRFDVDAQSSAIGQSLADLRLPFGSRLVMIERGDLAFIPQATSVIEPDDRVTLIGEAEPFETSKRVLHRGGAKHLTVAVMGGTAMSVWLSRAMKSRAFSVRVFVLDLERAEELAAKLGHVTVITADPIDPDVFHEEQLQDVDAFIAVDDDDERNILGCAQARALGAGRCIAVLAKLTYAHLLGNIGIDAAFSPRAVAVREILSLIEHRRVHILASIADGVADLYEVAVSSKSPVAGRELRNIEMPTSSLVAAIRREDVVRVPGATDTVQGGDRILVIGSHDLQKQLSDLFAAGKK